MKKKLLVILNLKNKLPQKINIFFFFKKCNNIYISILIYDQIFLHVFRGINYRKNMYLLHLIYFLCFMDCLIACKNNHNRFFLFFYRYLIIKYYMIFKDIIRPLNKSFLLYMIIFLNSNSAFFHFLK